MVKVIAASFCLVWTALLALAVLALPHSPGLLSFAALALIILSFKNALGFFRVCRDS